MIRCLHREDLAAATSRWAGEGGAPGDKRHGFTVIELLVVVAVIAVLLAVSLPVLTKARAVAAQQRCSSNLRQLHLAWSSYLADHNGCFYQGPGANWDYGGWRGTNNAWPRPLNHYIGFSDPNGITQRTAKVFCCPADRGGIPPKNQLYEKAYNRFGTSYQTNRFLIGPYPCEAACSKTAELDGMISDRLPRLNQDSVANPVLVLLMGDYGWVNQWLPAFKASLDRKRLAEWHRRADHYNMVFLDGHVALLEIRKGYYVTEDYYVLPFPGLFGLAREVQGPVD